MPGNFRRYALSAEHEPTAEQRDMLMVRRAEIDDGLEGADEDSIREKVGALRAVMASPQAGEQTLKIARQAFIAVLQRYPAWAVAEACARFLDGRVGSKVYAPTPAEVAEECRRLIAEALEERAKINAVLDAEIYQTPTQEERDEVARRYHAHVKETAHAADTWRVRPEDAQRGSNADEREAALRDLDARKAAIAAEIAAAEADEAASAIA